MLVVPVCKYVILKKSVSCVHDNTLRKLYDYRGKILTILEIFLNRSKTISWSGRSLKDRNDSSEGI